MIRGIVLTSRSSVVGPFSSCPLSICQHLCCMLQYLCTEWRDFNKICHKYLSYEWALQKRFQDQRTKVKFIARWNALFPTERYPLTVCCPSGGGIYFWQCGIKAHLFTFVLFNWLYLVPSLHLRSVYLMLHLYRWFLIPSSHFLVTLKVSVVARILAPRISHSVSGINVVMLRHCVFSVYLQLTCWSLVEAADNLCKY